MSREKLTISAFLRKNGISDPVSYLADFDDKAVVDSVNHPLVELRGSVHLMLGREISRNEVDARLDRLVHV